MVFEVNKGKFNHALYAVLDLDPKAYANEEFADVFKTIGADLMERHILVANGAFYQLVELEFYLNVEHHMDEFTHSMPQQKETAAWYFHRFNNGTYKSGTFKGLDITFARKGFYGGILIRGLKILNYSSSGSMIDGPSVVVDHLLRVCKAVSIADLVDKLENLQVCNTNNILHIAPSRKREMLPLYVSARVGLTLNKKKDIRNLVGYICRQYRLYTHPRETKKGRVQMILGLLSQGKSEEEVHIITGSPMASISEYLHYYREGAQLESFEYKKEFDTYYFCLLHGYLDSHSDISLI